MFVLNLLSALFRCRLKQSFATVDSIAERCSTVQVGEPLNCFLNDKITFSNHFVTLGSLPLL